jgi:hypothetical protein
MTTKQWSAWLLKRARGSALPFVRGQRYRVTTAPIKNKPELSFDIVGTFDRALTSLLFVDDNGVERRINSATITSIEELT